MPTHKRRKAAEETISTTAALIILAAALVLSGLNLTLMVGEAGALNGLTDSWKTLQNNYGSRTGPHPLKAGAANDDALRQQAQPAEVAWSVVKYRDGEQEKLWTELVQPLLGYYAAGGALRVVLIERKVATSRDVNVRLFFSDGTEKSYLWPSTHAGTGGGWQPQG